MDRDGMCGVSDFIKFHPNLKILTFGWFWFGKYSVAYKEPAISGENALPEAHLTFSNAVAVSLAPPCLWKTGWTSRRGTFHSRESNTVSTAEDVSISTVGASFSRSFDQERLKMDELGEPDSNMTHSTIEYAKNIIKYDRTRSDNE